MTSFFGSVSPGLKYSLLAHGLIILSLVVGISKHSTVHMPERIVSIDVGFTRSGPVTNLKNKATFKSVDKEMPVKTADPDRSVKREKLPKAIEKSSPNIDKLLDVSSNMPESNKEIDKILSQIEKPSAVPNIKKGHERNPVISDKPYDQNKPIMLAEYDNIRMQIERKFSNPMATEFAPGELVIKIKLDLKRNGEITKVTVLSSSSYQARQADIFSSIKDSLIRAVHMASPLRGLPDESYEGAQGWNEIELVFDAHHLMHIN